MIDRYLWHLNKFPLFPAFEGLFKEPKFNISANK